MNIDSLDMARFKTYEYKCFACGAYWYNEDEIEERTDFSKDTIDCPICSEKTFIKGWYELEGVYGGHSLDEVRSLTYHAKYYLDDRPSSYQPLQVLMETIKNAKDFIHFVTWGIDPFLLGIMLTVAPRCYVWGIASNASENMVEMIDTWINKLHWHRFDRGKSFKIAALPRKPGDFDAPHQKLIIIDGLIAFRGTNLTSNSWKKAAEGKDDFQIISNLEEIRQLNNKSFSPLWREHRPDEPRVPNAPLF